MTSLLTLAQAETTAQTQTAVKQAAPATPKTAGDQAQAVQQVPTAAPAQPKQPSFMEGLSGMLPFIIIIAAMFFLMWRGQSKERKRREEMMNSIVAGTKVLTLGGIYGIVDSVNGDVFKIKIADNVKIEINRNGIASVVKDEKAAEPAAEEKK